MRLRPLEKRDAKRMLEWMHDFDVTEYLQADFASKTVEDCQQFICNCCSRNNIHMAVTSDDDIYMGTVSLKNMQDYSAEFAIVLHKDAIGKHFASFAMKEMLNIGFHKFGLKQIYWCVAPENRRAVKFYEKHHFEKIESRMLPLVSNYTQEQIRRYIWYGVTDGFKMI